MVFKAFIIALISASVFMESRIGGQHMLDRPIILAPIIGLVMGEFQTGLVIGGTLELIWIGAVGIGTAVPPDVIVGSALATAFAIHSNASAEAALALAVPIATLAQLVQIGVNMINTTFVHIADRAAETGNDKRISQSVWFGAALYFFSKFFLVFFGFLLGADAFANIVKIIPSFILSGLQVATGFLPALGIAMLMRITMDKKFNIFLFFGFLLSVYLNLNTMAISLFGLVFGILYYKLKDKVVDY